MKYLSISRQKKKFKVAHSESGDFRLDYILLPMGYSYNTDIAAAKQGDTLQLFDGGEYPIVAIRKLNMKSHNTDLLCRMRYGIPLKAALMRWQMNAKLEGHGLNAVSKDECLWVVFDRNE